MSNALVTYLELVTTNDNLRRKTTDIDKEIIKRSIKNKGKSGEIGPLCHCKYSDGRPLEVRLDSTSKYSVFRPKGAIDDHASDCAFGQAAHATAKEHLEPICEEDGCVKAHVHVQLLFSDDLTEPAKSVKEPKFSDETTKPSQRKADPVTLLHHLFEKIGINRWESAQVRNNQSVFGQFRQVVAAAMMNSRPMKQYLHVAVEGDMPGIWDQKKNCLKSNDERLRQGTLLLGEIALFRRQQGKVRFRLKGIQQFFDLSDSQFQDMCKSFPRIWKRIKNANGTLKSCRIIYFGVVSIGKTGEVIVESMNLTMMSRDFIPCDSFLEVRIADKLVREGRRFFRVLHPMDEDSNYMADFEFLDMGVRWILEIFGMRTPDYLAEKKDKKAFWKKVVEKRIWEWDVENSLKKIPKFPPRPDAC